MMIMNKSEKYKLINFKGQNGYITLIAIAFIAVATMTLTALNSRITQFSKLRSLSLQDQSLCQSRRGIGAWYAPNGVAHG